MTYQFAGFLADTVLPEPINLPNGASWRAIDSPFRGTGVLLPQFIGKSPEAQEVQYLAESLGFSAAPRWLYLTYDCWAGEVDFVYGLGLGSESSIGPIEESDGAQAEIFVRLMGFLGVEDWQAFALPFFERGFWAER